MTRGTWRLSSGVRPMVAGLMGGSVPVSRGVVQSLSFGTGSGQFNEAAVVSTLIDPAQVYVLNLWNGSVLNLAGDPAVFANLRSFWAAVVSGGDSSGVKIAPAASNGNALWWGGTTPYKVIFPSGAAEEGGSPAGVAVSAAASTVEFTNLGAVPAAVVVALAGLNPMGANFFPWANLMHGIG